jgi:DNA helicase-2/ATP-dependent DNA helicase PcrA
MKFIADFHVHSRFSRATSKSLDLESLYVAAQHKGITVLGTGDFTHPGWFAEIKEKLVPAEPGLFQLKKDLAARCDKTVFPSCRAPVRFILVTEISNIYKKADKTRKNHNLVFLPDLQTVENFNRQLDAIGNIHSDGRPILGLDAKHLLEMVLQTSEQGFLVPAHVWTPWFSLLGSKSGFDSVEECFEDLTDHIFAVETGLSSDPAMNWRVSGLDGLTLISNSDAHSPANLGREANLFDTRLTYADIKEALATGNPKTFLGTFEFYPEEGKYHLDGHRKCGVRLWPEKTKSYDGKCPRCGKAITKGVLYRVEELADRTAGEVPPKKHPFYSMVPLALILSEILRVGAPSKKVQRQYRKALEALGSELKILHLLSAEELDSSGVPLLGEAVTRMRQQQMTILPGYDGEFGSIKIFQSGERARLLGQQSLFRSLPEGEDLKRQQAPVTEDSSSPHPTNPKENKPEVTAAKEKVARRKELNPEQERAVVHEGTPLLLVAGPGTGKTLTLTHRIAYLVRERGVSPTNVLAVTFTNKAAQEMAERLKILLSDSDDIPMVATFHSLCFKILKDLKNKRHYAIIDEADRKYMVAEAIEQSNPHPTEVPSTQQCSGLITAAKQQILGPEDDLEIICRQHLLPVETFRKIYQTYQNLLSVQGLYDYEDLILKVVKLLEKGKNICRKYQEKFRYLFIDEYQDLNHGQYRIVKALAPRSNHICVIGDPDQSIYGFRGSDVAYFNRFVSDYPEARVIHLKKNYRSTETILEASYHVIRDQHVNITGSRTYSEIDGQKRISILNPATDRAEAVLIGKTIEDMVGGLGFHSLDFEKIDATAATHHSFSDFAVLYRTNHQGVLFAKAFEKAGIPFQMASKENVYHRKGIQELLSIFKLIEGVGSYADLERAVSFIGDGVGRQSFALFKRWCFQNNFTTKEALTNTSRFPVQGLSKAIQFKLDALFHKIIQMEHSVQGMSTSEKLRYVRKHNIKIDAEIGKDDQTQAIFDKLIQAGNDHRDNGNRFMEDVSLSADTDLFQFEREKVTLMSMHSAKGLEFPVVFIAGCEDNIIPYRRSPEEVPDISEEKRLFYVAMTRAKEALFISHAKSRRVFGRVVDMQVSPFIEEIEKDLRDHMDITSRRKADKKEKQVQLSLFSD